MEEQERQQIQRKQYNAASLRRKQRGKLLVFKALCVLVQTGLLICGWLTMQSGYLIDALTTEILALTYILVLICMHRTYGGLNAGSNRVGDNVMAQFLSLGISDGLIILVMALVLKGLPSLWIMLVVLAVQVGFSLLWCILANRWYYSVFKALDAVVVYDSAQEPELLEELRESKTQFHMIAAMDIQAYADDMEALKDSLLQAESVFLCGMPASIRNKLLKFCLAHQLVVYIRPKIGDVMVSTAQRKFLFNTPLLICDNNGQSEIYLFVKRVIDIMASGLMLLLTSPIMLLVALVVKLEDHGPVFYRQTRLTQHGKLFQIYKFRSMRVDAEKDGVARLAKEQDDRVTRVGRFIRATRLDELPQLINILNGDMSLVGPRPERPEIAAQYAQQLPEFSMRLQVKAGLTGYAQVHGRYNTSPYDKLQMDLMYIADMSLLLDLRLMLQTLLILVKKESTQGVAQNQETAAKAS